MESLTVHLAHRKQALLRDHHRPVVPLVYLSRNGILRQV